nr:hypothetical protein CFP56_12658 [Quercus suber]
MSEFLTVHPPNLMLLSWPHKALCSNDFNTLLCTESSLLISLVVLTKRPTCLGAPVHTQVQRIIPYS